MSGLDALRELAAPMTDDEVYAGLDPALRAHLEDQVSMNPGIRVTLAVGELIRAGIVTVEEDR